MQQFHQLEKEIKESFIDNGIVLQEEQYKFFTYKIISGIREMLFEKAIGTSVVIADSENERYFVINVENKLPEVIMICPIELQLDEFLDLLNEAKNQGLDINENKF